MNTLVLDIRIKIATALFDENPMYDEDIKCDVCFKLWLNDDEFRVWFNEGGCNYIANEATQICSHNDGFQYMLLGFIHRRHIDNLPATQYTDYGIYQIKKWYIKSLLHCDGDLPAWSNSNDETIYYKNGIIHRDGDKPAKISKYGEYWYKNGIIHRDGDKPAVISQLKQEWRVGGLLHREGDKPAVIYTTGRQEWYRYGKLHRINGPAIINSEGDRFYYKNHIKYDVVL
jgi:hypothetical protein